MYYVCVCVIGCTKDTIVAGRLLAYPSYDPLFYYYFFTGHDKRPDPVDRTFQHAYLYDKPETARNIRVPHTRSRIIYK